MRAFGFGFKKKFYYSPSAHTSAEINQNISTDVIYFVLNNKVVLVVVAATYLYSF